MSNTRNAQEQPQAKTFSNSAYVSPPHNEMENLRKEIFVQHKFLLSAQQTHNELMQDEKNRHHQEKTTLQRELERLAQENNDYEQQLATLSQNNLTLEKTLEQVNKEKAEEAEAFLKELKEMVEEGRQSRAFYQERLKQEKNRVKNLSLDLTRTQAQLNQTQTALIQAEKKQFELLSQLSLQKMKGRKWLLGGTVIGTSSLSGILLGALGIVTSLWNPISWAFLATTLLVGIYCFYRAKTNYEFSPAHSQTKPTPRPRPQPEACEQDEPREGLSRTNSPRPTREANSSYAFSNASLFHYYNAAAGARTNTTTPQAEARVQTLPQP